MTGKGSSIAEKEILTQARIPWAPQPRELPCPQQRRFFSNGVHKILAYDSWVFHLWGPPSARHPTLFSKPRKFPTRTREMPKVIANTVIKTIHQTTAALQAHARTLFVCTNNQRPFKYVLIPQTRPTTNTFLWIRWTVIKVHAATLFVRANRQCHYKCVSSPPKHMLIWITCQCTLICSLDYYILNLVPDPPTADQTEPLNRKQIKNKLK